MNWNYNSDEAMEAAGVAFFDKSKKPLARQFPRFERME